MTPNRLYLSRLVLPASSRSPSTNRDLHSLHDTLWRGFRGVERSAPRPFLFRADRETNGDGARVWKVLLQSTHEAVWSDVELLEVQQRSYELALRAGEHLRFLLRANAVVSVKGRRELRFAEMSASEFRAARGLKVAVRGEEGLRDWLDRKALAHGFEVEAVRVVRAQHESWRARSSASGRAVHEGCDFEGHLRVVDVAKLTEAVTSGVGRGRGFGFGLLSLARDRG
jgi:CRISPR-associated protein Cas6/Cse3/CasE subtype I-E